MACVVPLPLAHGGAPSGKGKSTRADPEMEGLVARCYDLPIDRLFSSGALNLETVVRKVAALVQNWIILYPAGKKGELLEVTLKLKQIASRPVRLLN
ncbi:unnamed protein product [Urochloa humidicola]